MTGHKIATPFILVLLLEERKQGFKVTTLSCVGLSAGLSELSNQVINFKEILPIVVPIPLRCRCL
jgi:hypothetical protein